MFDLLMIAFLVYFCGRCHFLNKSMTAENMTFVHFLRFFSFFNVFILVLGCSYNLLMNDYLMQELVNSNTFDVMAKFFGALKFEIVVIFTYLLSYPRLTVDGSGEKIFSYGPYLSPKSKLSYNFHLFVKGIVIGSIALVLFEISYPLVESQFLNLEVQKYLKLFFLTFLLYLLAFRKKFYREFFLLNKNKKAQEL